MVSTMKKKPTPKPVTKKSVAEVAPAKEAVRPFPLTGPVTIEEVAAFLQSGLTTVKRLTKKGLLNKYQLPGTRLVRWRAEEVRKYHSSGNAIPAK